jgi:seryl-tRNA synthetase
MLDIKFIRENKDLLKEVFKNKGSKIDIDYLISLDEKRRNFISKIDTLRSEQNRLKKDEIEKAKKIKIEIKNLQKELDSVIKEYNNLMLLVPNIYSSDTPIGEDEKSNKEIYRWGEIPKFDFQIKNHIQLGKELDLIDFEAGVKTSGFRGYYLKNEAALISLALIWHCFFKMAQKGFTPMIPPTMLKEFALIGSGHFPFFKEEVYQIVSSKERLKEEDGEAIYLAGTSEPSLLAYFSNKILNENDLPIKICGFSQCYRSEVGSYGKDVKGLYRLHEFMKVEQVVLCKNSIKESDKWLEEMKNISCEILKELELPFRVIQICSGDMGAGKYKMYDIETWMPSYNCYRETHSDSNLTDWQSRRLNIKYKDKNGEKKFVYCLNNTVIASPRILIAILENFQQKDGSIRVPKVLQKYIGIDVIKKKNNERG